MNQCNIRRVNSRLAGGLALTGVGVFGLFALAVTASLERLAGIPPTLVVLAAIGGLVLISVGFGLMVLGCKSFDDEPACISSARNDKTASSAP